MQYIVPDLTFLFEFYRDGVTREIIIYRRNPQIFADIGVVIDLAYIP
jgi:hypothetical protein